DSSRRPSISGAWSKRTICKRFLGGACAKRSPGTANRSVKSRFFIPDKCIQNPRRLGWGRRGQLSSGLFPFLPLNPIFVAHKSSIMNLHEYQGKEILASYGVNVQRGLVAATPEEAVNAA